MNIFPSLIIKSALSQYNFDHKTSLTLIIQSIANSTTVINLANYTYHVFSLSFVLKETLYVRRRIIKFSYPKIIYLGSILFNHKLFHHKYQVSVLNAFMIGKIIYEHNCFPNCSSVYFVLKYIKVMRTNIRYFLCPFYK